jgi:hypothetical protein
MDYDIPTRRRWMRTIEVGTHVQVEYGGAIYQSKVIRISTAVVWVDGGPMGQPSRRFNKRTGEGWGTSDWLFPIDDSWAKGGDANGP